MLTSHQENRKARSKAFVRVDLQVDAQGHPAWSTSNSVGVRLTFHAAQSTGIAGHPHSPQLVYIARNLTRLKLSPTSAVPAVPILPESVPMDATRIVMHQIVAPTEVDALGICFGGQVLSWIDICAGLSAKTLARGPCVTISVDAVHFFRYRM